MLSLTRNHLRRLAAGSTHAAASIKKDVFPKSYSENAVNISETQTDVFPSESLYAVDEFSTGFKGVGAKAFSETVREALSVSINEDDIEVKPGNIVDI